jgi:hypothetical protein
MNVRMLLVLAIALGGVACTEETTYRPRSARSPYDDLRVTSGGGEGSAASHDMPGKGRAGEHHMRK